MTKSRIAICEFISTTFKTIPIVSLIPIFDEWHYIFEIVEWYAVPTCYLFLNQYWCTSLIGVLGLEEFIFQGFHFIIKNFQKIFYQLFSSTAYDFDILKFFPIIYLRLFTFLLTEFSYEDLKEHSELMNASLNYILSLVFYNYFCITFNMFETKFLKVFRQVEQSVAKYFLYELSFAHCVNILHEALFDFN